MAKTKKKTVGYYVIRVLGILMLLIGLYYLFFPHTMHVDYNIDFGLEHNHHMVIGGLLLILGSIFALNGKRLIKGIYVKGFKEHPLFGIIIYVITFGMMYFFFNSSFELLSGDINDLKIILLKISSVGLAILILLGVLTGSKLFGFKSARM